MVSGRVVVVVVLAAIGFAVACLSRRCPLRVRIRRRVSVLPLTPVACVVCFVVCRRRRRCRRAVFPCVAMSTVEQQLQQQLAALQQQNMEQTAQLQHAAQAVQASQAGR